MSPGSTNLPAGRERAYQAIVRGAAEVVAAAEVALVRSGNGSLTVLAASPAGQSHRVPGQVISAQDARSLGFVVASGQPLSVGSQTRGTTLNDAPSGSALLCVPCIGTGGVVGALEIRAEAGVQSFAPEATRVGSLFADVAAALLEEEEGASATPSPSELAAELGVLAKADPARYVAIASALEALLAHG